MSNPDVFGGSKSWYQVLYNDFWGTPLTDTGSHGSYRPLCVLSFRLNYLLGGFKPIGYHAVNVILHAIATLLVIKLARILLPRGPGPTITGLLFACHPIHTEAIAGIVGRADITACIFYLLTFITYTRHVQWRECGTNYKQWIAIGVTIIFAIAAILCKETAVTSLVICAIYDIIKGFTGSRDKVTYIQKKISKLSVFFSMSTGCRFFL